MVRLFYSFLFISFLFLILLTGCNFIISMFDGIDTYDLIMEPHNTHVPVGDSINYHLYKVETSSGEYIDISRDAQWVSANPGMASVSSSGYVVTYVPGSVTITANYMDETVSTELVIDPGPEPTPISGLIAEYKFDGNCEDTSGNGMHATEYGTFNYIPDRFGNSIGAAYFNGAETYAISPLVWNSPLSFTISVWVNVPAFTGFPKTIMGNCSGMDLTVWRGFIIQFEQDSGNLIFFNVDPVINQPSGVEINTWHHIVFSYNNNTGSLALYIDGIEIITQSMTYTNYEQVSENYIGAIGPYYTLDYVFHGAMDDMMIYDWALTAPDVYYLYTSQAP